jgi:hypothetical protein
MNQPRRLIRMIQVFVIVSALAGASFLTAGLVLGEWHGAVVGSTLLIVSAVAAAVLAVNALLADREAFFCLGELDGWMRGWRGQEPRGADDPPLRRP